MDACYSVKQDSQQNIPKTKINPKITCRLIDYRQYYEIEYFDTIRKETVIGYGSFNLKFVEDWYKQYF